MIYEIKTKEYFKWVKNDIDVVYKIKANSIDEAVKELYPHMKHHKWTKESIKKHLLENYTN